MEPPIITNQDGARLEVNFSQDKQSYFSTIKSERIQGNGQNKHQTRDQCDENPELESSKSIWPFIILILSLILSTINALLLSFVSKSIDLSESGLNDESIKWDKESNSNVMEMAALMGDKTIELNSIESSSSKPMRLIINLDESSLNNDKNLIDSGILKWKFLKQDPENEDSSTSYFAINYNLNSTSAEVDEASLRNALEIGTKMLYMRLIGDGRKSLKDHSGDGSVKLLELDTQRDIVVLPSDNEFDIEDSSLRADQSLICPSLLGSVESNFEVQARDGDLTCKSEETMKLQSKTGDIRLSSSKEIKFDSSYIRLNGSKLYIPKGISYLDMDTNDESELNRGQVEETVINEALDLMVTSGGQLIGSCC